MAETNDPETNVPELTIPAIYPVCLNEDQQLKVVGQCQHAFCSPCLATHIKDDSVENNMFLCPTCRSSCSYPDEGIGGLMDYVFTIPEEKSAGDGLLKEESDRELSVGLAADGRVEDESPVVRSDEESIVNEENVDANHGDIPKKNCDICHFKDVNATATMSCEDCDDMNLCEECTEAHRTRPRTKTHVLKPVGSAIYHSDGVCKKHGKYKKLYCRPCNLPLCVLCAEIGHHEHDVSRVEDVLAASIENLRKVIEKGQRKIHSLKADTKRVSAGRKAKQEWKDTVFNRIESNLKEMKDQLMKTVDEECRTTEEDNYLKNAIKVEDEISAYVDEGEKLLSRVREQPEYCKSLAVIATKIQGALDSDDNTLIPIEMTYKTPSSFNADGTPGIHCGSLTKSFTEARYIVKLQLPKDPSGRRYPICDVRCLGENIYAALCRPKKEPLHIGEDIYDSLCRPLHNDLLLFDTDGELQNTVKNLPLVHGMDVNGNDRVVLLSDGQKEGMFCVQEYDAEGNNTKSSKEFPLSKPLSMAASADGHYYILSEGKEDTRTITTVSADGDIIHTTPIVCPGIGNHTRITCGRKYVYTLGENMVAVHVVVEGKITFMQALKYDTRVHDISATPFDDAYIIMRKSTSGRDHKIYRLDFNPPHYHPFLSGVNIYQYLNRCSDRLHVYNHTLLLSYSNETTVKVYKLY